jgi:hypothetical protein
MTTDSNIDVPEPPPVLVRAFLDASLEALQFLVGQPGFRSTVAVEKATGHGFVPVSPDMVNGPFSARRAFATTRLTGELTYGERELEINLIVGPMSVSRAAGQYALWEWIAALGASANYDVGLPWLNTAARLRSAVAKLGDAFREHAASIAAAGPDVIRRIEEARTSRRAESAAQHAEWAHQNAAVRAADAFRAGDYAKVVALLEPIASHLTPAEQKKLALALKRL